jgi:bifunctional DNA-binding transcriptional regulator/antitoxin component of YhaV-PrlF toxin-antitoxin module
MDKTVRITVDDIQSVTIPAEFLAGIGVKNGDTIEFADMDRGIFIDRIPTKEDIQKSIERIMALQNSDPEYAVEVPPDVPLFAENDYTEEYLRKKAV